MNTIEINLPGEKDYFTQEAVKSLRTNLQFCGRDIKVIAITSVNENEGKSTIALHIGKSFAELGKKVLVVDADMRKSVIAGRNTTAQSPNGLSELLTGLKEKNECFYQVKDTSLKVLFSGPYPPNPVELLDGEHFSNLLEECRNEFDYVIIDTPPLGQVIDAAVIAEKCDGAAIVLGSTRIHYRQAQEVVSLIEKSGCKVLGVIRNHKKISSKKYYYRKYYKSEEKTEEKTES